MSIFQRRSPLSVIGASMIALGITTSAAGLDLGSVEAPVAEGDTVFSNSAFGGELDGDANVLASAIADGAEMGVTWYGWQGKLKAPCQDVTWTHRGDLRCTVEVWFDKSEVSDIPDAHGLRVAVHSTGRTSTMVLVSRTETQDVMIHSIEQSRSPVEWYVVKPGQGEDDGAYVSADED